MTIREWTKQHKKRLQRAAGAREGAWQATSPQIKAAARKFLAELRAGTIPKGYVVEITKLGKIRYQVIVRGWH